MFKFASQGFSSCFTAVNITKTSQELRKFSGAMSLPVFEPCKFLPEIQEVFLAWG